MSATLTDLTTQLTIALQATAKKALDLGTPQQALNIQEVLATTFGTGELKANDIFHDRRILAASADEGTNLDLAGALSNAFGDTLTFSKIKALIVINRSDQVWGSHDPATAASISVGGAAANTFAGPFADDTDKVVLPAGDVFVATNLKTGWTVTAGTGDILLVSNETALEALYDLILWGEV